MRTPDGFTTQIQCVAGYVEGWLREEAIFASAEINPAVSLNGSIREFRNNVKSFGGVLSAMLLSLQSSNS
jgi:hypothetical protein